MLIKLLNLLLFTGIYCATDQTSSDQRYLHDAYDASQIMRKYSIRKIKFWLAKLYSKQNAYFTGIEVNNQLNNANYWPIYRDDKGVSKNIEVPVDDGSIQILSSFIQQELLDENSTKLISHQKIQKQFIFLRWMSRILVKLDNQSVVLDLDTVVEKVKSKLPKIGQQVFMDKDPEVYKVMSHMSQQNLWEAGDISSVLNSLTTIYSVTNLTNYTKEELDKYNETEKISIQKSLDEKHDAWGQTMDLLQQEWSQGQDLKLQDKFKQKTLSWFTSDVISIEAKRAVIRALLTKIRRSKPNNLTKARYIELTGYSFDSLKTYLSESIWNSRELENDTKQDGYLDQVITLFLLFVKDILGLDPNKSVGSQQDSNKSQQVLDITTGYGSTGYSKQDIDGRAEFVDEVRKKLKGLLLQNTKSVIQETDTPRISFEINQKEVYYLAELANAFYQFISAEMDKSGKDLSQEDKLTDTQLADAKTEGSYIQRQEEYNLDYLRQWFVRTRSIHPIVSWLFQNYNPHMSQKISFSAAYWHSYSFISDWRKYYGEGLYNLIAPVFKGLGKAGEDAWQYVIREYFESISTTPS